MIEVLIWVSLQQCISIAPRMVFVHAARAVRYCNTLVRPGISTYSAVKGCARHLCAISQSVLRVIGLFLTPEITSNLFPRFSCHLQICQSSNSLRCWVKPLCSSLASNVGCTDFLIAMVNTIGCIDWRQNHRIGLRLSCQRGIRYISSATRIVVLGVHDSMIWTSVFTFMVSTLPTLVQLLCLESSAWWPVSHSVCYTCRSLDHEGSAIFLSMVQCSC